jgi:hypothetical protein
VYLLALMEGWRKAALTKEEEGFVVDESVECADETFTRSLVGKLWTTDHYNVRIFKQVITQESGGSSGSQQEFVPFPFLF